MIPENCKNLADEYPTVFTDVFLKETNLINQNYLNVKFGKPARLIEGVEGFDDTTLKRYLEMDVWTLLQCALLAAGVLPEDGCTAFPGSAMGLDHKRLEKDDFRLREAKRILVNLNGSTLPEKIIPFDFYIWLKYKNEIEALKWLSEIEEFKSETITDENKSEIKEQKEEIAERKLWDIVELYIIEIIQNGQYASAKELFRVLERKAGQDSPFDKGTGNNRDGLFVREISKPLVLKTLQNNWKRLRTKAGKK